MKKSIICFVLALCVFATAIFSGCTGMVRIEERDLAKVNDYYIQRLNKYDGEGLYLIEGINECAIMAKGKEGTSYTVSTSTVKGEVTVDYSVTEGSGDVVILDKFFYFVNFDNADKVLLTHDGQEADFVKVVRGNADIMAY